MDKIKIQNLEVFAKHGVFVEETVLGQKFFVNAMLHCDTHRAGRSDCIGDSTNYGEVCHFITTYMTEHTFKLIEAVAEQLAEAILLQFPLICQVDLEIKKPWAPIGLPLEYVSVEISRGWHQVYLSIGSNMGDKKGQLDAGVNALTALTGIRNVVVSEYLETEPYGGVAQDTFLNGAVAFETLLSPEELLTAIHRIEAAAGRERLIHWGPRTLDMDILFYDDLICDFWYEEATESAVDEKNVEVSVEKKQLIIPHVDMANRQFVLKPLAELCPGKVHPVLRQTVVQMLCKLQ